MGWVPVVITTDFQVEVGADASVHAATTAGAKATFSAQAGVGWSNNRGFYPIASFRPGFSYTLPSVSADASVDGYAQPTVNILLYGVAGPKIALKAGPEFDADIAKNPWWTLGIPVDLTASVGIPELDLSSPTLHVYRHTFQLVHASCPFGGCPRPPAGSVTVTDPGDQTGTVGVPAHVQIAAKAADRGKLTYGATGLPAGLSINPASGLISGTPTTAGTSAVTVTAREASGASGQTAFHWTVNPAGAGGNVLLYGDGDSDEGDTSGFDNLQAALTAAGFAVTTQTDLPDDLSPYSEIWRYGIEAASDSDQTRLIDFVKSGGGLFLTGERPCCEEENAADGAIVNALVSGGGVPVGGLGDIGPCESDQFEPINAGAEDGVATDPHVVSTWHPECPGGLTGVTGKNVLATGAGGTPVAAVWDGSDIPGGGRLALLMDVNWAQTDVEDATMSDVAQNLATFLAG